MSLDKLLFETLQPSNPIGFVEGATFLAGMKKMAEEALPDVSGEIEGPFMVPLPQAVELIAQMVSNEFKTQTYYVYYANMLRGLSHEGIAEEFMEHAENELEHANYLLRRMGVLSPGGISIPPYPPPKPLSDANEIIKEMIVVEQIGLSLWKQLHSIMGDNPMKFTIEQFLQREEEHQDELWQLVEPGAIPEAPTAEGAQGAQQEQPAEQPQSTKVQVETGPKTAEAILNGATKRKLAAVATYDQLRRAGMDPGFTGKTEHDEDKAKKAADLTAGARAEIKDSNFVFPESRKYPIHDKDHALAALGMVAMHGSADEKSKVRAAVEKRYPGLHTEHEKKAAIQQYVHEARTLRDEGRAKKDQTRVELDPKSPASLRAEKPDVQKKTDNTKSPKDVSIKPVGAPVSLVELVERAAKTSAYVGGAVLPDGSGFFTGTVGKSHGKEKKSDFAAPEVSPEEYMAREKDLAASQAIAEASHAKTVAMQSSQAAQQAQAEAQAAQQQLADAQAQIEQLSQQAQAESQQSMMATQQAAEAEARAADHSIGKMQLGMRVNQLRQELANLVMQDPVAESAGTVSDLAAQGMPATPQQQADAEAMAQQQAMGQDPNAGQGGQQPQGQQQPQDQDQSQAQPEQGGESKDKKPGTHVTVKTSADMGTVVARRTPRGAIGEVAAPAASGLGALVQKARPYLPHIAAGGAGLALIGGGAMLANRARQFGEQQKAAGVVDSTGRAAGRGLAEGVGEVITEAAKKHAPSLALGGLAGGALYGVHRSHERAQRKSDLTEAVAEGMRRAKHADQSVVVPIDHLLAYMQAAGHEGGAQQEDPELHAAIGKTDVAKRRHLLHRIQGGALGAVIGSVPGQMAEHGPLALGGMLGGALIGGSIARRLGDRSLNRSASQLRDLDRETNAKHASSPADRRLARAILEGGESDTLGRNLVDLIRKTAPGDAAEAAAHQAVNQGVASAKAEGQELLARARPHLPGFVAGLGTGILGTKALSNSNQQQPQYYGT